MSDLTIQEDLVNLMWEIGSIQKGEFNDYYKSAYVNLESLLEYLKPLCKKHRFVLLQKPSHANGERVLLETLVLHLSGESFSFGTLDVPLDKANPQQYGSALSYARRYALLTAFQIPTVDDDGNAGSKKTTKVFPTYKYRIPKDKITDANSAWLNSVATLNATTGLWEARAKQIKLEPYLVTEQELSTEALKKRAETK